ncbi:hypothetical protein L1887_32996, partial [Cichorium endivia]
CRLLSTCLHHPSSLCDLPKAQVRPRHYILLLLSVDLVKHLHLSRSKQQPLKILKSITAPWPPPFSPQKHARRLVVLLVMLKCSLKPRSNKNPNLKSLLLLHNQLIESISSTTVPRRCLLPRLAMTLEGSSVSRRIRVKLT